LKAKLSTPSGHQNTTPDGLLCALVLAAYLPPAEWPLAVEKALLHGMQGTHSHIITHLYKIIVQNEKVERQLAREMGWVENLKCAGINNVTCQVSSQYGESPFPKWDEVFTVGQSIVIIPSPGVNATHPRVLAAGAGTGRVAFQYAHGYGEQSDVTAIDISPRSLAFGKREALEKNITNIRWKVRSILDLNPKEDGMYDVIQCTGVLHHLEHPEKGFEALNRVLKPGGSIQFAVYSEKARQSVVAVRKWVKKMDWRRDRIADLRALRRTAGGEPGLRSLYQTHSFYRRSQLVDLCFHAMEHRYNYLQLYEQLQAVDWKVLANIYPRQHPQETTQFKMMFPSNDTDLDLRNWHQFELKHGAPTLRMYHILARKPNPKDGNVRYAIKCEREAMSNEPLVSPVHCRPNPITAIIEGTSS